MKRRHAKRLLTCFIAILILLFSLISSSLEAAESGEGLLLAGEVMSIYSGGRLVVIDVKNKGCNGPMTFTVNNIEKYGIVKGDRVNFMIDSARCPDSTITAITDIAKVVPMHWRIKR